MGGHSSGGLFKRTSGDTNPIPMFETSKNGEIKPLSSLTDAEQSPGKTKANLIRSAKTDEGKRLIDQLYREGATEGDGGTADAIRKQLKTGELTGKKDHIQKGEERVRQIDKILKREPDHPDRDLFELLKNDLKRALGGN